MSPKNDKVLDAKQWRVEAQAIINDVHEHVRDLQISNSLNSNNRSIHLNLTTLEGLEFCVRLSSEGFSIVSNRHNCSDNAEAENLQYFETIYGLLDTISPQYRNSFGNRLMDRLQQLTDHSQPPARWWWRIIRAWFILMYYESTMFAIVIYVFSLLYVHCVLVKEYSL